MPFTYLVTLFGGTQLLGQIQGAGGPIPNDRRLRFWLREQVKACVDRGERPLDPRVAKVSPDYRGEVSVWTDPDNSHAPSRLTRVLACQIDTVVRTHTTGSGNVNKVVAYGHDWRVAMHVDLTRALKALGC